MTWVVTIPPWRLQADFAARLKANWGLKLLGIPGFIAVFFIGYFAVLRFPQFPVTVIPATALDRAIPFQPVTLIAYCSLWLYVSLPPSLLRQREKLFNYGKLSGLLAVAGLAFFFFWPTMTPATTDPVGIHDPALAWVKIVDASGNACPSLHVAFAVLSGIKLDEILRGLPRQGALRFFNVCWGLAIIYSTMSIRQHVAIDVLAGSALGLLATVVGSRLFDTRENPSLAVASNGLN